MSESYGDRRWHIAGQARGVNDGPGSARDIYIRDRDDGIFDFGIADPFRGEDYFTMTRKDMEHLYNTVGHILGIPGHRPWGVD